MEQGKVGWTPNWFLEPVWQNYSSMYREAVSAHAAVSGMEIAHHRMAALYFGMAALESFLNREMTRHQVAIGRDHGEIKKILSDVRIGFKERIRKWPMEITGKSLKLRPATIDRILTMSSLRGDLTHQKNFWPRAFEQLARTDSMKVVELVAEYIVAFHQAKGELFPYWVWGWNYLNPSKQNHEIALMPYTQFIHSIRTLGYEFKNRTPYVIDEHAAEIMSDYAGYEEVDRFLKSSEKCEPKWELAPFQPKLCKRWWDPAHHRSCGAVTQEAIEKALEIDRTYLSQSKLKNVAPTSRVGVIQTLLGRMRGLLNLERESK